MWDWIARLSELQAGETPFALVTLIRAGGSTPRETGARMIVLVDGTFFGTIGGGGLERWAIDQARACLSEGTSRIVTCVLDKDVGMPCGGRVEFFMEAFNRGPRLYVFGGGHVGRAITRVLAETPFSVHVIDERDEWIAADRFPEGTIRHATPFTDFIAFARWDDRMTYVAIVTHSADRDREVLAGVIRRPARYVGMIGSRTKWQVVLKALEEAGIPPADLERVRCPFGNPAIKGKTPQEIAISLAAEILAIHDA